ncbi:MAG TPA: YdeI/OmpD-associated family protein [Gemmatimonadales bacterium]
MGRRLLLGTPEALEVTFDRMRRYAILWRIQTAKRPETRAR